MESLITLFSLPESWLALLTLSALEIVLGVDNIIFLAVFVAKLPLSQQKSARTIGLALALFMRVGLLFSITWVMGLVKPVFTAMGQEISWRDIILISGGLFLLYKSTMEIHASLEGPNHENGPQKVATSFLSAIFQIGLIDLVFSLDSVITAVGLVKHIEIMIIAVVISIFVMLLTAASIGAFIDKHPTLKMLAFSFLLVIGVVLVCEGFEIHIPKGYVYFAMAFSCGVEALNLRLRSKPMTAVEPIQLRRPTAEDADPDGDGKI